MASQIHIASVQELESGFQQVLATNRWAAAESAYALAARYRDVGAWEKSREWVRQCLLLLEGFPSETEGQVATIHTSLGGVDLPNYLHEGIVRARFGELA
ncbi:hypothetical protein [Streptomyces sp. NPDC088400]|uniref:hypothetical protein n=1 Tax=Streptomyces sp. NPDC088400 TaxID=3365861 RepID=UPI00382E96FB